MSHEVIPPTIEDLKELGIKIPTEGKVVLDIFTEWCGPCKQIGPILHSLQDEGKIKLVQEDLDKNEALATQHHIHAIPTLIFFKDGKRIGNVEGDVREVPLDQFFAQVSSDFEFGLVKDGKPIENLSGYQVSLKRMVVKDGVMVGFPGEDVLKEIIEGM